MGENHCFLLFPVACPKGLVCVPNPSLFQLAGTGRGSRCSPSPATSPELFPGDGLAGPDRSMLSSGLQCWEEGPPPAPEQH